MLRAELLDRIDAVLAHRDAWDELAVALDRPYCAPGWMLAWWHGAAPPDARLRVAAVFDGDHLMAVAPCFAARRRGAEVLRFLAGGPSARVEPLARPGVEAEAARLLATTLGTAQPRPDALVFDGVPSTSPWPRLLAAAWPGGQAGFVPLQSVPAPFVEFGDAAFGDWLGQRSRNFRQQMRRARRKLETDGAVFRWSTPATGDRDLQAFARLHYARWEQRGSSQALDPAVERMLHAAAHELLPGARLRLHVIEAGGEHVAVHLFVAAGRELGFWLGGHDDRWASAHPGQVALLDALESACADGFRRVDLGPGAQPYKYRFTSNEDRLEWTTLVPRGPRAPLFHAYGAARRLSHVLPESQRARVKRIVRAARRRRGAG